MMPGLAKLMEEVAAAAPPGLLDELWRLVYTRGHCDVDRARPHPGRRRALPPFRTLPSADTFVRERIATLRYGDDREEALAAVRRELPELHRRIREMQVANASTHAELVRLESEYAQSRARTQATYVASRLLDALAQAPFTVTGLDAAPEGLDDPARAD